MTWLSFKLDTGMKNTFIRTKTPVYSETQAPNIMKKKTGSIYKTEKEYNIPFIFTSFRFPE